ncbi:MAG: hypothetical protein ACRD2X_04135 [Vicinamibacteraceae bacterium]
MHVPGWHDTTKALQAAGRVQMVGIIQEQHPDRARLFMQWKQMDWPILVDSLNLLGVSVVPVTLAVDEHGIIRAINPKKETIENDFVSKSFDAPAGAVPTRVAARRPNLDPPPTDAPPDAWRQHAERLFLWGGSKARTGAIEALERAHALAPDDAAVQFRLGVAYRARYDSPNRQPGDFRRAVEHWQQALAIDPNQYIWRRRIQQYGPRLGKPYPFYDWVSEARDAIRARGDTPEPLGVEPSGAELAHPAEAFEATSASKPEPDPKGRIHRDRGQLIQIEALTVPTEVAPGTTMRAHLVLRPNLDRKAHWNNEVDDLVVWVNPPEGWQVDTRYLTVPRPKETVSQETRRVEFELRCPETAAPGRATIPAYALYYVCEDVDGTCLYQRQDVTLDVHVRR